MKRRAFMTLVVSAAAWPLAARAQAAGRPVIGYIGFGSLQNSVPYLDAFRRGLDETGFIEGQNVLIEYRWLEGQYDRMSELAADLVRREVAVIATPGTPPASVLVVMARTATIPIVFAIGDDPVKWGIVANLGPQTAMRRRQFFHQRGFGRTARVAARSATGSRSYCRAS